MNRPYRRHRKRTLTRRGDTIVLLLGFALLVAVAVFALGIGSARGDTLLIGDCNSSWPGGYGDQLEEIEPTFRARGCAGSTLFNWLPDAAPAPWGCEETDATWLYRDLVLPHLPIEEVWIQLGSNDAAWVRSQETFRDDLERLVEALLSDGVGSVLLIAPPPCVPATVPVLWSCLPHERLAYIARYGAAVRSVCDGDRVHCGPDLFDWLDDPRYFLPDGIHLTAAGHDRVFDALSPMLLPAPNGSLLGGAAVAALILLRGGSR